MLQWERRLAVWEECAYQKRTPLDHTVAGKPKYGNSQFDHK